MKANTFFRKSELMFTIGLALMLICAFKEEELPVKYYKSIGWVCTYIFAIGLLRKLQIFFRRTPKVKPKKGKQERKRKDMNKTLDIVDDLETPGKYDTQFT